MSLTYPVKLDEDELNHICAVLSDDKNPRAKPILAKMQRKLSRLRSLNTRRMKHDTTNRKQADARTRQDSSE